LISKKKTILEAAALLSELYEQKDTKESLHYLKISDAYKDTLFGAGNIEAIQTLVAQEEEHQKEIAVAKISYQNKMKQYALFAGLGILFLIAIILYRNNQQKQKANIFLQKQKEEIDIQKNRAEKTLEELKSTQSQLIQSEKMASLGELTAGIAHEIQNPLNFVNNFSEVNKELIDEATQANDAGNTDEVKELLTTLKENEDKIIHHGKRADAIVKGMLQHSRSSTGKKEPTNINALADEYLRLSYHGLRAKDKSFNAIMKTDFDQSIGAINIIPQDIGRVLLNLYNNAFYAVTEKKKQQPQNYEPTVSVSTKKINDKIEIRVKDNGNGIPQKVVDKIFQPFFTTKPTGVGTGLGLSLSYDIVKAHGGEIKAETKQGEGSEFVIQLQD
jgi:two-component system NtrC family sensor kinase